MFGNSGAKTLLRRRNTSVPMVGRLGRSGLNIFLCLPGSLEGKSYGNGVKEWAVRGGWLNGHTEGLPAAQWNLNNLK